MQAPQKKSRPKAASGVPCFDRGSGDAELLAAVLAPIRHEPDTCEAEDHHRPCGRLGHTPDTCVNDVMLKSTSSVQSIATKPVVDWNDPSESEVGIARELNAVPLSSRSRPA
jgi:hypothetical protein